MVDTDTASWESGANRTWWDKVWTGDAYTLNLVKCTVGSVGFVVMGLLTTGGGWLSAVTPAATLWLVLSSFLVRIRSAVLAREAPTASLATSPGSPEAATRTSLTPVTPQTCSRVEQQNTERRVQSS